MSIILKHTFKNIFKKPLRTLLVVFCVFICSFVALVSLDMSGALENLFKNLYSSIGVGNTDIVAVSPVGDMSFLEDDYMPENKHIELYYVDDVIYTDIEGEYTYVLANDFTIAGIDFDKAKELKFLTYDKISDDEVIISEKFADKFGYKKGEEIILHDEFNNPVTFKIASIVDDKGLVSENIVLITENKIKEMMVDPKPMESYIDLKDDSLSLETVEKIKEAHPTITATSLMEDPQLKTIVNIITKLTTVLFAICILMVIFVTISVSERIISERMSVVGTLRSVGVSAKMTTMILLLENAIYGLLGSIPGCLLYSKVRATLLTKYLIDDDGGMDINFGKMKFYLYIIVIISAILIECLCPLKEIIKASSTPIRDLIFMNKDTEYRFSRVSTIGGIACIIISVILFFVPGNFYVSLAQIFLLAFALSLLYPYIQYALGKILYKLFDKTNWPIAKLAATEVFTKKSTFGSSVLITTSIALAIIIYTVGMSLLSVMVSDTFDSTNQIATDGHEAAYYSFVDNLDGVSDVQYFRECQTKVTFNGKKYDSIMGVIAQEEDGTFGHFVSIDNCGPLKDDEVSISEVLAKELKVKEGDEIEVVFNCESYYPITRTLTLKYICDTSKLNVSGMNFIVSSKTYNDIYGDTPAYILFNSENPDESKEFIDKYAKNYFQENKTAVEAKEDSQKSSKTFISLIRFAIAFGVMITFIGAVSNLLIGFEGRKRECAVLMSTSLPRKKLNKLFLLESFFASGAALLAAVPAGIILYLPVEKMFSFFNMNLKFTGLSSIASMMLILWIVFTMTSLFIMKALRKMKLAEQLKYE